MADAWGEINRVCEETEALQISRLHSVQTLLRELRNLAKRTPSEDGWETLRGNSTDAERMSRACSRLCQLVIQLVLLLARPQERTHRGYRKKRRKKKRSPQMDNQAGSGSP